MQLRLAAALVSLALSTLIIADDEDGSMGTETSTCAQLLRACDGPSQCCPGLICDLDEFVWITYLSLDEYNNNKDYIQQECVPDSDPSNPLNVVDADAIRLEDLLQENGICDISREPCDDD